MFDGISPTMLYKLNKKQEETTRSLEKIEKGESAEWRWRSGTRIGSRYISFSHGSLGAQTESRVLRRVSSPCYSLLIATVCYALRLRLVEFGDKPEVLRQMAKRALEDANVGGGEGRDE